MKKKEAIIQIRIDKDLKDKYLKICDDNCFTISKKIRQFILDEIKNHS